jgi:hypothetical protein
MQLINVTQQKKRHVLMSKRLELQKAMLEAGIENFSQLATHLGLTRQHVSTITTAEKKMDQWISELKTKNKDGDQ